MTARLIGVEQVLDRLRRQCRAAGSQNQWAHSHGMTSAAVNQVLTRKRRPTPQVLKALGLCRVISYRRG